MSASEQMENISKAVDQWLKPDNTMLKEAIDQTVDEGLFSLEDIKFQILHLKKSINKGSLLKWVEKSGFNKLANKPKRIVCLHAGNLPLVGIQDVLAVLLSGHNYFGKLSKKDPYLLESFLAECQKLGLLQKIRWTTELRDFEDTNADAVLFTGSGESVENVNEIIENLQIAKPDASQLIRTAHFSIAYITDHKPETFRSLTEAVFRYGGTGCRSVAIVVAPFHLDSEKCEFTDYVESFWLKNPQNQNPEPSLFHHFAYNKATGVSQSWLDDFLIEESRLIDIDKFILHWVKGGWAELEELVRQFEKEIQSVYSTSETPLQAGGKFLTENLSIAQKPPIWWRPDGVDTLQWIQQNL
ncbi:MAG: hypothetical protein WD008_03215 [Balneolaceae bacterium]